MTSTQTHTPIPTHLEYYDDRVHAWVRLPAHVRSVEAIAAHLGLGVVIDSPEYLRHVPAERMS